MKIPVSWLREFVDVTDDPGAIGRRMSLRGFAVEGIDPVGDDDAVIDFEVTANRPDCLSVVGMAREIATAYDLPLSGRPETKEPDTTHGPIEVDVLLEAPELCPRYVRGLADVTVGPSPEWIQRRLLACGIRPISNIVDITNYVLLELGQPMHAFDQSRLDGERIRVRHAHLGETLSTLDGQSRILTPEMLVIADARKAVAVAGVMGGAKSEVTETTRAVVLESAYFDPLSVRRTSKTLGLKTEASTRFERGTDPHMPRMALNRALDLIEQTAAGTRRGDILDRARMPFGIDPKSLLLRRSRIERILGVAVPDRDVERVLSSLGFSLVHVEEGWRVSVPTRRIDVGREIDVIEEVARHIGFDRVPATFPAVTTPPPPLDPRIRQTRDLRALMTAAGFCEAVTFGFIDAAAAAPFASEPDIARILNPLSETFAVLRPSLVPGLVAAVAHNRRRQQRDVRLFEVGARFTQSGGERRAIGCAWTGAAVEGHWSGGGREVDVFDIIGIGEQVSERLGVAVRVVPHREPWLVPGRTAALQAGDTVVGRVGQLLPAVAEAAGLPATDALFVAEIDIDQHLDPTDTRAVRVRALPRYPSVTRDLSVLVNDTLPAGQLRATMRRAGGAALVDVREFDRYQGKGIPDGQVSVSFRLTFRSLDRTLTDAEVQESVDDVVNTVGREHGAVQR